MLEMAFNEVLKRGPLKGETEVWDSKTERGQDINSHPFGRKN